MLSAQQGQPTRREVLVGLASASISSALPGVLIADQATAAAARADEMQARGETLGPLHGLPVAHKDLLETAGVRTTFGSPLFKDNVPIHDNLLVTRMRAAGAIFLGKT